MVDLDQYDPETLTKAFWLQAKIKRDGIEGIGFMEDAHKWNRGHAADTVADNIDLQLNSL